MNIKELEKEINQGGYLYKLVNKTSYGSVFSVNNEQDDTLYGYEVFKRKLTPVCVDFEKRIFSETEFKEQYPKSTNFGVWAFAPKTIERANQLLQEFENEEILNNK